MESRVEEGDGEWRRGKERKGEEKRRATYLLQSTVHFWMLLFQVLGIVHYFVELNWFSVWQPLGNPPVDNTINNKKMV